MKRSYYLLVLGMLIFLHEGIYASDIQESMNDSIVYVWKFNVNDPSKNYLGKALADDFETELIQSGLYTVLERRRYDRVLSHQQMESRISTIENLSSPAKESLIAINAQAVFFGEVFRDTIAGLYKISVKLQLLDGKIPRKGDVEIPKAEIEVPKIRKNKMKELVALLHAADKTKAKQKEYDQISNILEAFMMHLKNVHFQASERLEYAFENQMYLEEYVSIISSYNEFFNEFKPNHDSYHMSFTSHWNQGLSDELYEIFDTLLDDIHDKYIFRRLNTVTVQLLELNKEEVRGSLSKSQLANKKKRIIEDAKRIATDLYIEIQGVDKDINTFLKQLKDEMEE